MPQNREPTPRSKVTVRDVAGRASVSIGTVSRALKNQPGLTQETRQRVLRVALELGYDTARLRQTKLRRLSFLTSKVEDLPLNPFYSHVLHGVESACRDDGAVLSFGSLRPGDCVAEVVHRHQADGLVCAGYFEPRLLERVAATGLPIVLIDHFAAGYPAVNMDNDSGGYSATQHLRSVGCERIAYIGGPPHHSIIQRQCGYHRALMDAGLLVDRALEARCDFRKGSAYTAMKGFLGLKRPPDGVFAFNDQTALEAMRAALDAGFRIPEDIAFVGFDDIDFASHSHPPLSTVQVDKELLGRLGFEVLTNRDRDSESQVIVPVELMIRRSSSRSARDASPRDR